MCFWFFFFFNDPATPEIYTLPLHAPLPISPTPWSPFNASFSNGVIAVSVSLGGPLPPLRHGNLRLRQRLFPRERLAQTLEHAAPFGVARPPPHLARVTFLKHHRA